MIPCEQKGNIEKLFAMHEQKIQELSDIKVKQAEIHGIVTHVQKRIENGMSSTIHSMDEKLTILIPQINHQGKIVAKIEDIGWWISKLVIAALLLVLVWAIANGAHIGQVIKP